ncbi:hypothetical protein EDB19DRAFT_281781 [Suillus lakei]|nr:hypothetical protein EDB19DRAFT_281781 [Suillus lakei]
MQRRRGLVCWPLLRGRLVSCHVSDVVTRIENLLRRDVLARWTLILRDPIQSVGSSRFVYMNATMCPPTFCYVIFK